MNPVRIDTDFNGTGFISYKEIRDIVGNRVAERLVDDGIYLVIKPNFWRFIRQLNGDTIWTQ